MTTFAEISRTVGTRFKFATDIEQGIKAEYMIMPTEGDDYWIQTIINIHPKSPFVGVVSKFKSDDAIAKDEVIISQDHKE